MAKTLVEIYETGIKANEKLLSKTSNRNRRIPIERKLHMDRRILDVLKQQHGISQ